MDYYRISNSLLFGLLPYVAGCPSALRLEQQPFIGRLEHLRFLSRAHACSSLNLLPPRLSNKFFFEPH
jgi:hypothetical protein